MTTILIYAESQGSIVTSAGRVAIGAGLTAARLHGAETVALIAGHGVQDAARAASRLGVSSVIVMDDERLANGLSDITAAAIAHVANTTGASLIIGPGSSHGKAVMPRVAVLLQAGMASEVAEFRADGTVVRGTFSGKALEALRFNSDIAVVTVSLANFDSVKPVDTEVEIETVQLPPGLVSKVRFVSLQQVEQEGTPLPDAKIVVSGGRGLKSGDGFRDVLGPLVKLLGRDAAMGASRAACDSGWVPATWQVGQTGVKVAPDVYLAVGISGAIQHLAGIGGSKVIVAVNKDREAPIFGKADFGIVGDLFAVIPALVAEITRRRAG